MKKKWFGILLSLLMVFGVLFQGTGTAVFAEGTAKKVDATVTKLSIQNLSGSDKNRVYHSDTFYLAMDWDASSSGANLHEGDYFDITLPDKMVFPSDSAAVDFNIYGSDGITVIAKAHVNPGTDNKGGNVRVTFTNWVEGKENVKGNIRLSARFDKNQITIGKENTFSISVSGQVVPVTVTVTGPTDLEPEIIGKWGQSASDKAHAEWYVRINHQKATLSNVVISDHLSEGAGSETYVADSFKLIRVKFTSTGDIDRTYETVNLDGKLTIAGDGKSFTLKLGDVNGDQYRLSYKTTYTAGTTLHNNTSLTSTEQSKTASATHISADSGGSGTGTLANKIKLTKVDADDNSITLSGAVFEVTRPDGSTFELTTGDDGTVTSGSLTSGIYKIKEKSAPAGYQLNDDEYSLQVTASGGALQTIKDEPTKTSVSVNKKWVGTMGDAVTVHLYADGKDTGKIVTLNTSNRWKDAFDNLRKYTTSGSEIKYTVREDVPTGYEGKVTGSQEDGYTITNTNIEKISVPVTKTWVGKVGKDVTVKLFADKRDTGKTVILNAENQWKDNFTDLPKYDGTDGHEIDYTIEEVKVDGYNSVISGTAGTGFTITNTITGKVSIPVTKIWVGKAGSSATIRLYADGKEVDSVTLNHANNWQHTFTNLEKYKDGKEIRYTVKEEPVDNYKTEITGDATSGYTVRNTNTEKVSVPITKQWVGKTTNQIKVKLLADNVEKATATLTADGNWKHTFTNLPKYDESDGHEIVYTVAEVKVDGYVTGISGTAKDGFTITNTITGKVSIPVTKKWIGGAADSITVNLYADGKKVDTQKLSKENHWQYTFKGLDRYKDGNEITYTIKEEKVSGYATTITGDAKSGFMITNTKNTPKSPDTTSSNTPKTGDNSNLLLYVGLMAASLGVILFLVRKRRKQI
ncbi:hypothetical protein BHK98_05875 [Hornefia porci]|uniref:Gram-positive cocci surface proteins LPxTG domain-containing protein n=1 Tax=Hornefia porci TaxID=2652292 RepID=A0A1Q9JHE8_9FIRM|nr:Cna B-type domain-containing protein [Hornefia porci]OLR55633.1 hypothetical protein BHK98_05875 [Hornefia porci]